MPIFLSDIWQALRFDSNLLFCFMTFFHLLSYKLKILFLAVCGVLGIVLILGLWMLLKDKKGVMDIKLKVEKYHLENGMTVLLHRDTSTPMVFMQATVRVGSVNEETGKTGLAHLFEHLMFRGTKRFPQYDKVLDSLGASNNAFTSRDMTSYFVSFFKDDIEKVMDMEADRITNLVLDEKVLDTEREVVKEERRLRTDNNPADFFEPLLSLVFPDHPYGPPIIGSMKDLDGLDTNELKDFYRAYYAPNNIILTVSGHFNMQEAKDLIKKYFAPLEKTDLKPAPKLAPPVPEAPQSLTLKRDIKAPILVLSFPIPPITHPDYYTLSVMDEILTGGDSSRLHKLLVLDKKLALDVGGMPYSMAYAGIYLVYIKLRPGAKPKEVKQLVLGELKKLKAEKVTDNEVLKSVRSYLMDKVQQLKQLQIKTIYLSESEFYYRDYNEFLDSLNTIQKVTAQNIKEAAFQYLQEDRMATLKLIPQTR